MLILIVSFAALLFPFSSIDANQSESARNEMEPANESGSKSEVVRGVSSSLSMVFNVEDDGRLVWEEHKERERERRKHSSAQRREQFSSSCPSYLLLFPFHPLSQSADDGS